MSNVDSSVKKAIIGTSVVSALFVVIIVAVGLSSSGDNQSAPVTEKQCDSICTSQALSDLSSRVWEHYMKTWPEYASYVGDHRYDDKLMDMSMSALSTSNAAEKVFLQEANGMNTTAMAQQDTVTLQLLKFFLQNSISSFEYKEYLTPINQLEGFQYEFPAIYAEMNFNSYNDYEMYATRLRGMKPYIQQVQALLEDGIKLKRTLPKVLAEATAPSLASAAKDRSSFLTPFFSIPASLQNNPDTDVSAMLPQVNATISEILDTMSNFHQFWVSSYIPACSEEISSVKSYGEQGQAFYEHKIYEQTSVRMSAQQVHDTGLAEVQRIVQAMKVIIDKEKPGMSVANFSDFLRTDSKFYFTEESQLLEHVKALCKDADGQLPKLFKKLPRCPYGVVPILGDKAKTAPAAYYYEPTQGCSRAGFYHINTYNLPSRPWYLMESTGLHETVPGHHLQIALSQEIEGLPAFRRFMGVTSFIEGWALYSESLGEEMGFYTNPYNMFGRYGDEILRACRLVVDSGMHALGWSRQQAIDFMLENTPLSLLDITSEVDRYITWPGQALAYKTGELHIQSLKAKAQSTLGSKFDVRDFHDAVLSQGGVTLEVLTDAVNTYISKAQMDIQQGISAQAVQQKLAEHNLHGWKYDELHRTLHKTFPRTSFQQSSVLVTALVKVAEQMDHHPSILLDDVGVRVETYTHSCDCVSQSDVELAVKVEEAASGASGSSSSTHSTSLPKSSRTSVPAPMFDKKTSMNSGLSQHTKANTIHEAPQSAQNTGKFIADSRPSRGRRAGFHFIGSAA